MAKQVDADDAARRARLACHPPRHAPSCHPAGRRDWFQEVVAGSHVELPWDQGRPPYDPDMAFTCERPSSDVLGYYREQCNRSDEILAGISLSDVPRGSHGDGEEIPNVRVVILHVIEETAAHSGHLEIARELLDGTTGRGLR
jgi:Protein of unknown function (DUF664)